MTAGQEVYDDQKAPNKDGFESTPSALSNAEIAAARGTAEADNLEAAFKLPSIDNSERNTTGNKDKDDKDSKSPLGAAEDAAGKDENQLGKGFTGKMPSASDLASSAMPTNAVGLAAKAAKVFWSTPTKKGVTVGGCATGAAGIFAMIMIIMAPMKLISITQHLQDEAFGGLESGVSDTAENLLGRYLIKQVMPGMVGGACNTTRVEKSCAVLARGTSPVAQLYNAWRDARLESKLATKYGIEIIRLGPLSDSTFYIRAPRIKEDILLGKYSNLVPYDGNLFAELDYKNRNQLRLEIKQAFANETMFKRMLYRHQGAVYLSKKFGVSRCFVACETLDKFKDWKTNTVTAKKQWVKGKFAQTFFSSTSEANSLLFECLLSNFDCANYKDVSADGTRPTKYEEDLNTRLREMRASGTNMDDFAKKLENVKKNGVASHLVGELFAKFGIKISSKFVPIVGQIDLAVMVMKGAEEIGPMLKYANYAYKAGIMATWWINYRSAADEQKSGNTDMVALGELTNAISSEGGVSGEQSPAYQSMFSTNTSLTLASILSPNAYAAQSSSEFLAEHCDEKPDEGALICKNESLSGEDNSSIATAASIGSNGMEFMCGDSSWLIWMKPSCKVVDFWFWASSGLVTGIFKLFQAWWNFGPTNIVARRIASQLVDDADKQAGQDALEAKMKENFMFIAKWWAKVALSSPYASSPNAVNNLVLIMGGAYVTANELIRDSVGGGVVDDGTAAAIKERYMAEQKEVFKEKSMFARMFDSSSQYSLRSQMALSMPSPSVSAASQYATNLSANPVSYFSNIIGSLIPFQNAKAAPTTSNIFGLKQYSVKPILGDPEALWEANNCSDPNQKKKWTEDHHYIDEATGQLVITAQNDCKVLESVIQSVGGMYDSELLPPDTASSTTTSVSVEANNAIVTDGYAWPVDLSKADASNFYEGGGVDWNCNTKSTKCHRGSAALDIAHKDGNEASTGKAVFAVTTGKMYNAHNYKGKFGCYSFHIKGDDGWDYYYTHVQNAIITSRGQEQSVTAGQKIAEIGTKDCGDTAAHLHIDRGSPKGYTGGETENRDLGFVDLMIKIHNNLPQ